MLADQNARFGSAAILNRDWNSALMAPRLRFAGVRQMPAMLPGAKRGSSFRPGWRGCGALHLAMVQSWWMRSPSMIAVWSGSYPGWQLPAPLAMVALGAVALALRDRLR